METTEFNALMRIQIDIAIAHAMGRATELESLEVAARALGLSGAAIDAAKQGRSFDAVIDVAVAHAIALYRQDQANSALTHRRLIRFGSAHLAQEIELHVKTTQPQSKNNSSHGA
ncbi:hypothetical protein ACCS67_18265 [Rhizobium brockwellii]|uniref:hypothetical protein n=1 Tax=Rhizobium brockwellii TaxID=3019932 RepID=UPI003F9961E6